MNRLQAWLNSHPTAKYLLSTAEGAMLGVMGSYLTGVVNGVAVLSVDGLKRTAISAVLTGVVAAYNTWKTPPTLKS